MAKSYIRKPGEKFKYPAGKNSSKQGKRKDIPGSPFTRSSWEANTLRVLEFQGVSWEYEPETFYFDEIKRGTRTYTPDIKLIDTPNQYRWLEVKGYLRPQDRTKLKRFKKYCPEEFAKLMVIPKNPRVEAAVFFAEMRIPVYAYYDDLVKTYKDRIKGWE